MPAPLSDAELLQETRMFVAHLEGIIAELRSIDVPGRWRSRLANSSLSLLIEDEGFDLFEAFLTRVRQNIYDFERNLVSTHADRLHRLRDNGWGPERFAAVLQDRRLQTFPYPARRTEILAALAELGGVCESIIAQIEGGRAYR